MRIDVKSMSIWRTNEAIPAVMAHSSWPITPTLKKERLQTALVDTQDMWEIEYTARMKEAQDKAHDYSSTSVAHVDGLKEASFYRKMKINMPAPPITAHINSRKEAEALKLVPLLQRPLSHRPHYW